MGKYIKINEDEGTRKGDYEDEGRVREVDYQWGPHTFVGVETVREGGVGFQLHTKYSDPSGVL